MKHVIPVKENIDPTLKAYFKVGEEIFPSSAEELYVKLANLVSDYFEYYDAFNKKQKDYDASINIVTNFNTKIMTLKAKIFIIEEQIRSVVSGEMSSSDVKLLRDLASQLYVIKKNLETMQKLDTNNRRTVNSKGYDVSSVHTILISIIDKIRDILKDIVDLDINGIRRLERIKMTGKHEEEIKDIFAYSKDYASIFTSYMYSTTDAKVTAYNVIEAIAEKIVSLYNHNVLGEGFSADELNRYRLADDLLSSATENLINSPLPSDIDKLQSEDIPILNEASKYLSSGLMNPELIERYKTEVVSYNNRMLLRSLENSAVKGFNI